MSTYADKTQEDKSQAVSAETSQLQSGGESTFQFVDNRPEAIAQRKLQEMANNSPQAMQLRAFQKMANNSPQAKQAAQLQVMANNHSAQQKQPIQKKENNTGLPDNLKTGMENLSGMSLDDVKVHHNSDKPAQLQAHAYAQGTDIHLGPGQEKHLPHEAWHVVQQKQGRVRPTMQMKGKINVNDDARLEKEADVMGAKSLQDVDLDSESTAQKKQLSNNTRAEIIQKKTVGELVGYTGQYVDAGNGLYVAPDPTDLLEVKEIVNAIREKMHADKKYQKILILSGCHGDPQGNLYAESDFYKEDLFNEGKGPIPISAQNVTLKSKKMLEKGVRNDGIVRVLGWCFSQVSNTNWATVVADWEGF